MKNLQASCNKDANSVKQAKWEQAVNKNLNMLIDLATDAVMAKDKATTKAELKTFNEVWNHHNEESEHDKQQVWHTTTESYAPKLQVCWMQGGIKNQM